MQHSNKSKSKPAQTCSTESSVSSPTLGRPNFIAAEAPLTLGGPRISIRGQRRKRPGYEQPQIHRGKSPGYEQPQIHRGKSPGYEQPQIHRPRYLISTAINQQLEQPARWQSINSSEQPANWHPACATARGISPTGRRPGGNQNINQHAIHSNSIPLRNTNIGNDIKPQCRIVERL